MTKFAILALIAPSAFSALSRNLKRGGGGGSRSGGYSSSSYSESNDDSTYCYYASESYYDYEDNSVVWGATDYNCPSYTDYYYETAYSCDEETRAVCSWEINDDMDYYSHVDYDYSNKDDDMPWMEEGYASASALASAGVALVASAMLF